MPPSEPSAPRPQLVEVRFDSSPSGSVFSDGGPAELCRTPCSFDIDLSDGGPADRRTFIVKRAGYRDRPVTVDLTAPRREFAVTLQRSVDSSGARAEPHARDTSPPGKAPERRPKRAAKPKKDGKDAAVREPREAKDLHDTADAHDAHEPPSEPPATKPAAKKPLPPIDPADTLDPFHPKQ